MFHISNQNKHGKPGRVYFCRSKSIITSSKTNINDGKRQKRDYRDTTDNVPPGDFQSAIENHFVPIIVLFRPDFFHKLSEFLADIVNAARLPQKVSISGL